MPSSNPIAPNAKDKNPLGKFSSSRESGQSWRFPTDCLMALKSIAGNKLRSALTMLGIIIGVMALVILVSLVSGATGSVSNTINSLGSNLLTVSISDSKNAPVSYDDLESWVSENEAIGQASPIGEESMTAKYGTESETVTVYGTTPAYYDIEGLSLKLGRFLKEADIDSNTDVCIINEACAEEVIGFADCLGNELSLNGMKFTVVGVLDDDASAMTSAFGSDSYVAYIPYSSLVRLSTTVTDEVTEFAVSAPTGFSVGDAETAITEILMKRFDEDDDAFKVSSQDSLEDAMSSITSVLTVLLGGIAAISLLVGGIGIMNIMLVTVTERTREIGIRKAIGATRGAILSQFLIEAIVLSMCGCLIGIFLSWVVLQVIGIIVSGLDLTFTMNGMVVLIAVSFCLFIGVVFGIYPANKAATMKPIDALHYDG